jgi:hypothetical protein
MKNLFIYHPETGTLVDLSEQVYLLDPGVIDPDVWWEIKNSATMPERDHKGRRLDNYNMTNLFFGGSE